MHEAAEEAECEEAAKGEAQKAKELEASEMEPSFGAENMTWGDSRHHIVEAGLTN